jgi:hypothetical protein
MDYSHIDAMDLLGVDVGLEIVYQQASELTFKTLDFEMATLPCQHDDPLSLSPSRFNLSSWGWGRCSEMFCEFCDLISKYHFHLVIYRTSSHNFLPRNRTH